MGWGQIYHGGRFGVPSEGQPKLTVYRRQVSVMLLKCEYPVNGNHYQRLFPSRRFPPGFIKD